MPLVNPTVAPSPFTLMRSSVRAGAADAAAAVQTAFLGGLRALAGRGRGRRRRGRVRKAPGRIAVWDGCRRAGASAPRRPPPPSPAGGLGSRNGWELVKRPSHPQQQSTHTWLSIAHILPVFNFGTCAALPRRSATSPLRPCGPFPARHTLKPTNEMPREHLILCVSRRRVCGRDAASGRHRRRHDVLAPPRRPASQGASRPSP
jgi:hypothetical protein